MNVDDRDRFDTALSVLRVVIDALSAEDDRADLTITVLEHVYGPLTAIRDALEKSSAKR